jgi:ribose/xylose/arabinose/galactoside ABC-type transport system permease subunit
VSRDRVLELLAQHRVALLCVVLVAVLSPVVPGFSSAANLRNVFSSLLPLLAVAVGQTLVLITGGIDLSVTAVVALASVLGARVMTTDGGLLGGHALAVPAAVSVMLATGLVVGAANGLAVSRLRMPPFLATLAVMTFASGFAIWFTRSQGIAGLPEGFRLLGAGSMGDLAPVPVALLVVGPLALGAHVVLTRTVLGHWLFAVGGGARTARVSGVPVERVVLLAYVACAACAAVASILYTARLETGSPVLGQRILLDVIGAVVIGGTSLFGGRGSVLGTVYGALFITLLDNGLNLMGLSSFTVLMVKGAVILAAALVDATRERLEQAR